VARVVAERALVGEVRAVEVVQAVETALAALGLVVVAT
jgi:hypothetical protein